MSEAQMAKLVTGSVVRTPRGGFRVIRDIRRWANSHGDTFAVMFAIKCRSWTGRPYTVYTKSDLRTFGYTPTIVRVPLRTKMDKMLAKDMRTQNSGHCRLTPEDVRGLP